MYRLIIKEGAGGKFATIKRGDQAIECADGLFVDAQDETDLKELISFANKGYLTSTADHKE